MELIFGLVPFSLFMIIAWYPLKKGDWFRIALIYSFFAAGVISNFVVVEANGGKMPVFIPNACEKFKTHFIMRIKESGEHSLAGEKTRFPLLSDRICTLNKCGIASIGDFLIAAALLSGGIFLMINRPRQIAGLVQIAGLIMSILGLWLLI